ncbi:6-hydroxyaminopurine reductase [Moellerella wisconsensis]|uniref:6-N-hydroxylaminopurine resistance protein n=2 Tax=Moellerella wisconsensis TaxID=158849 RepID=A0ACD3Y7K9_9GAMM|nr:6-hydroxyaminopurine reductase [Moellerella wisconsensis]KLN95494.1 6-N-hydroxylaminopurine resistance protein [Moellerella wisconsensis]UNH24256.1 6-N-hydroxylaminopurine resistance protein [Moellerella wisconsensis]UNH27350.1 6-N-hydroxylaminopurine resistance protein [Moellerella wisconsensis]UNH30805.1 6-N-hydroxylaminopurine resistance protein [Moellerella wisconsensis]UNH38965.1 6-N-hydroxylaminopurine resistance protein [Moellerella wisconsensis]
MEYHPQVFIGKVQPTGHCGNSGIDKHQVGGLLQLLPLGLAGDEQAEKKFHGGPDRALCQYPAEHYHYWSQCYPELIDLFIAPAFGENLSTTGMNEENVFIGDIYRWGDGMIQVTQPRSPCYKLNRMTGLENFSLTLQNSGRCGWLYRVIKGGSVSENASLQLLSRNSDVSVKEAIAIAFHLPFDMSLYRRLLSASGLSASWSYTMQKRIEDKRIEDFNRRLFGHD